MATSLYNLLQDYRIVIPIIQRDYAQGRKYGKVPKIRERFLNALFKALKEDKEPLELDFIYGYTKINKHDTEDASKSFIPLDGQQRLTTLFLLYWYIAVKENHLIEAQKYLSKFTYETRHSSSVFCKKLVLFNPDVLDQPIKKIVINQSWFFNAWNNDPTISSMLTMLSAIEEKLKTYDLQNVWPLLTSDQPKIVFHMLPMEKIGLPDDLYIKMNSRGKELTEFEYLKSQFSEYLPKDMLDEFNNKIDQKWSDLFWNLYKEEEDVDIAQKVDNGFVKFINYITDILIFKHNIDVETLKDEFDVYEAIYSKKENVTYLFNSLNKLYSTSKTKPNFFSDLFYVEENKFELNKVRLFFQNPKVDLFKKCAGNYDPLQRNNPFSIGEQLMLYAYIEHLNNETDDFNTRIRKVRNLISNSEDTVRKENMQSLLDTVSEIILNNHISDESKFSKRQIDEEVTKQLFIESNGPLKKTLYKLEDHHLLQGCLAIFDLDNSLVNYSIKFAEIFKAKCDYDDISCALLSFGDYSQKYSWRWRYGNNNDSVWRELLTPSQRREGFKNTKNVLYKLLNELIHYKDQDMKEIISAYLNLYEVEKDKPKEWKYYLVKYPEFRKNEDGFYYWKDKAKPYESIMMRRSTMGGFNWSPFLYILKEKIGDQLLLENYGAPLLITKSNATLKFTNHNNGYKIEVYRDDDGGNEIVLKIINHKIVNAEGILEITQNEVGLDMEDRIDKGIELITAILKL